MSTPEITLSLPNEDATDRLGQKLASLLKEIGIGNKNNELKSNSAVCIYLQGDLGTGKTALTRALLRACGVTGRIKSPSYALLESYKVSSLYFYHIDFYRFSDSREWLDAGLRDVFSPDAVVLIEWPEKAGDQLPPADLHIHLSYAAQGRLARIQAYTKRGASWLTQLGLNPTR
jgi:tRNA threonylcarbamoyladenosine biosynthesis protein TsaE